MNSQSLKRALTEMNPPSMDGLPDFKIISAIGLGFFAKSKMASPALLIPLEREATTVGRQGGGFSLTASSKVAFDFDGRQWEQSAAVLECTEPEFIDAFLVLVLDISERLNVAKKNVTWQSITELVDEWQLLLGRRRGLSDEEQVGLWGELWFLSKATSLDVLMKSWRGPDGDAVDFFFDGVGLEIKTSRRKNIHHMSYSQARDPVGSCRSFLVSIWISPEPSNGVSLVELIDVLIARAEDPAGFLRRISQLGYSPAHRDEYSTRYRMLSVPLWFRTEDVPQVRLADDGVTQLRYLVSLNGDTAVDSVETEVLWRHFLGADFDLENESSG